MGGQAHYPYLRLGDSGLRYALPTTTSGRVFTNPTHRYLDW